MKASELIGKLQQMVAEHGDLPIIVESEFGGRHLASGEPDVFFEEQGILNEQSSSPAEFVDGFVIA